MPLVEVDPNKIKFDAPQKEAAGFVEVDPSQIQFDAPAKPQPNFMQQAGRAVGLAARDVAEGVTALPLMVGDAANALVNLGASGIEKLTGSELPRLGSARQSFSQVLTQAGLPQPETPTERVVSDIGQAVTGLAPSVIAGRAFPALAELAKDVPTQLKAAAGSAGGAGIARELDAPVPVQIAAGIAGGTLASKVGKPALPMAQDIKAQARAKYQEAAQSGGVLSPKVTNTFIDAVDEIKPRTEAGRIVAGKDALDDLSERLKLLRDKPLSLDEAQDVDEAMSDLIDKYVELGKPTKEGLKIIAAQDKFRNAIEAATPEDIAGGVQGFQALKDARKLWAKSARLADVERIITRAEMMDNPATGIKTGFRTLYNNPSRMRGFSEQERKLIKNAAESGIISDLLRTAGSRLLPIGASITGSPVAAAASYAGAAASRNAATKVQMDKASRIINEIIQSGRKPTPDEMQIVQRAMGITSGLTAEAQ